MDLLAQYRELHAAGYFTGRGTLRYAHQINAMIRATGARSLLDYGCGKGEQYSAGGLHKLWGLMPALYDPAVEGFDQMPAGRFDGVICCDVLEHLDEPELGRVIEKLFACAKKFVFLTVCDRAADKHLPDGRNAHLTLQPEGWWLARIKPRERRVPVLMLMSS